MQLDIERACPQTASVHRAENLYVAYRVERETFRDAFPHDRQQLSHPLFRIRCVDEIEIASFDRRQIGHQAGVDPVRINDDPALGGLPEDLGQAHNRHSSRSDDIAQNLPWAHRRQLIDIADEQQCRALRQRPKDRPHQGHINH